ncbi:MAG: hypothetical protein AAF974_00280 [Cyanobacteria bacterium P01_E01_bin.34]
MDRVREVPVVAGVEKLRHQVFLPGKTFDLPHVRFWLAVSLLFAAGFALMGVLDAFQQPYTIQDDARQHVFWMQRFLNPDLFPDDLIADYYQSIAPRGYSTVYRLLAGLGLSPILTSKVIPPVLFVLNAGLMYLLALELLPIPAAAFSSSLLLSQSLGMTDAVFSGTAKAFVYLCALSMLYCLVRGWLIPLWVAIALQSWFYPQLVLVFAGMLLLGLVEWKRGRWHLSSSRQMWMLCLSGIAVCIVVMLPFLLSSNPFGPTVPLTDARKMPEFLAGGRTQFFYDDDPARFWLDGRGGIRINSVLTPVTHALGLAFPLMLCFPRQFPLIQHISKASGTGNIRWLPRLAISSLFWFAAAHATLFILYLPSRFTEHPLRLVLATCTGLAIATLIDAAWKIFNQASSTIRSWSAGAIAILLSALLLGYPLLAPGFPFARYTVGRHPELYEFFQAQPEDITIASLGDEGSFIATFAHRSVLVDREFAIPYHTGYYRQIRQRATDLIAAQYSLDSQPVLDAIANYTIDFWVLTRNAFNSEALHNNRWLQQYQPTAQNAEANLRAAPPILSTLASTCTVFETRAHQVLDSTCIQQQLME